MRHRIRQQQIIILSSLTIVASIERRDHHSLSSPILKLLKSAFVLSCRSMRCTASSYRSRSLRNQQQPSALAPGCFGMRRTGSSLTGRSIPKQTERPYRSLGCCMIARTPREGTRCRQRQRSGISPLPGNSMRCLGFTIKENIGAPEEAPEHCLFEIYCNFAINFE